MSNKIRGTVDFASEGVNFTLKLSTNAICELENLTGKGINEFAQALDDPAKFRIADFRAIFFACLMGGKSDIADQGAVGDLIDDIGMEKASELIAQVFANAFPEAKEPTGEGKAAL